MSGCYGNSREDRYFEGKLNDYLDSQYDGPDEHIEVTLKLSGSGSVCAKATTKYDEGWVYWIESIAWTFDEDNWIEYDNLTHEHQKEVDAALIEELHNY